MNYTKISDFKDKIKNWHLLEQFPDSLNFHDAEIEKIEVKSGELILTLYSQFETPFYAILVLKNAVFKELNLNLLDNVPSIIYDFLVAQDENGKFHVNINFCISPFSEFNVLCDEIEIAEVIETKKKYFKK